MYRGILLTWVPVHPGVSTPEFGAVGESLGSVDVDQLFKEIDKDGSGDISVEEFLLWWETTWLAATGNKEMNEKTMAAATIAFHELDEDGSGELERNEIVALLHKLGVSTPESKTQATMMAVAKVRDTRALIHCTCTTPIAIALPHLQLQCCTLVLGADQHNCHCLGTKHTKKSI